MLWKTSLLWLCIAAVVISGCAGKFEATEALQLPESQVATIERAFGSHAEIKSITDSEGIIFSQSEDGYKDSFKLVPGEYSISATTWHHKMRRKYYYWKVSLEPGHEYLLDDAACYLVNFVTCRGQPGYTQTVWLQDQTTGGEVVAGKRWW